MNNYHFKQKVFDSFLKRILSFEGENLPPINRLRKSYD